MGYEKNFLITIIALVFVILKHSLQWRGEFHLYFGPVPEFLLVNSAAKRFSMAASFEGKFLSSFLYSCFHWPYLVVQVYELITCVRRANENAGNLISVVQFLINMYISIVSECGRVFTWTLSKKYQALLLRESIPTAYVYICMYVVDMEDRRIYVYNSKFKDGELFTNICFCSA